MKRSFLLSLLFCLAFSCSQAQTGTTFWFVCPEVSQSGGLNLDRPIFLRMTAVGAAATVTISQPAGGGLPTAVLAIPAGGTVSFDLTPWIDMVENKPADMVLNYGIEIQSTAPITAYYDVVSGACLCNPEDFVLKGDNALGTDFWIPGQDTLNNSLSYTPTPSNAFDIVATQNATTVTITPSFAIVGHAAGVPFTEVLNMGQTYSATAISTIGTNHLRGSRVTSDKPIAITEKDDLLAYFPAYGGGDDLIGDQIVPVDVLGTEYIPMYGNLSTPGDQLFITATQTPTTVSLNGVLLTTLTAGQTYRMNCPNPSGYIQTSFPAYVYQLSGIIYEVGSALLPQINCTGSSSVSIQQSSTIDFKLNLLVKSGGQGNFLVNGAAGVITAPSFVPVPGTAGAWYSAQITMPIATYPIGSVLTVSNTTNLFQLGYLSSGPPGSGADFGYFSNYGGINPNPSTTSPSLCIGDSINLFSDAIDSATYLWSGPNGFSSTLQDPFITGAITLDSGTYKVTVTTPGCTDSGKVTIAVHAYPAVNLGPDTTLCNTMSLTLASDSTTFGAYLWNTGATTATIPVTVSGAYWLSVSNAGCTKSDTENVTFITVPVPVVTPVTYCQYAVAAPLTATGTSLTWWTAPAGGAGSATAPVPSTATTGVTLYYVTSTSGVCESARVPDTVTVNVSPPTPFIAYTSPYCQGQPFIPMAGTGGTVLWWDTPTGGTSTTVFPTVNTAYPGVYNFYESQIVNGCESPRHLITVTVLDSIIPAFGYSINYGCNGDTVVFNNSSTGAAAYTWSFGDGYSDTATDPKHIYTAQGIYTVTLIAGNHFCADSTKLTDSLIHRLHAGFASSPLIYCQDSLVSFVNLSDSLSDGPLSFVWLFGDGSSDNTAFSATHVYKNSGVYNVQLIATDFIPCSDTSSLKVYIDSTTALSLGVTDSVICRSTYITFTGNYTGIGNTGVSWSFGDGDSIKNVNPVAHAYDAAGTYTVTVTPHYRACRDTSVSKSFTIYLPPAVNIGGDTSICPGSDVITIADNINKPPGAQWLWNTGETTPGITISAPGSYWVKVTLDGCTTTDSVLVRNDCYMDIPNAFTPNGDGMNDYFFPRQYLTKGLTEFSMNIYNRWGQLIFQATSLNGSGWDGKFNNVAQPEGVYIYVIDAQFKDGQKEHHQGNVTLLR